MLKKARWYWGRFSTFSIPELWFRIYNKLLVSFESKSVPDHQRKSSLNKYPASFITSSLVDDFSPTPSLGIFEKNIDLTTEDFDWHKNIQNLAIFPKTKYNKIDTRSNKFGDAKYVWEVNRLQFLIPLAIFYSKDKDIKVLKNFIEIISYWGKENPYLIGVNWYSNIEVNIRLIVWFLCWNILDVANLLKKDIDYFNEFVDNIWLPLIYSHCIYSYKHPSKYSSANNHLIAEATGLFIASSFWKFEESEKWCKHSKKILEKEIILQHSENGINKEESGEYIHFITDFFLLAYIVAGKTGNDLSNNYSEMLNRIIDYIYESTDADCKYPRYGDDDDGFVFILANEKHNNFRSLLVSGAILFADPKYKMKSGTIDKKNLLLFGDEGKIKYEKLDEFNLVPQSKLYFEEGHFYLKHFSRDADIYFHFNAAPLGYHSIAAHGHADALSFEMRLNNKEVFVDPGTYSYYGFPEWRNYFRSTLAHNTVCIDYEDQAKQAGAMMWLNHYKTEVLEVSSSKESDRIKAAHNGYEKKNIKHIRTVSFDKSKISFIITDEVVNYGSKEVEILIPFHLHPSVIIKKIDKTQFLLNDNIVLSSSSKIKGEVFRGSLSPKIAWYSKSYGYKEETNTILFSVKTSKNLSIDFIIQIKGKECV